MTKLTIWQINGVREYLDENGDDSEEEGDEDDDLYESSSPVLLFGNSRPVTKDEILVDIPPRSIADRLISRFLKTTEPAIGRSSMIRKANYDC
jgi:hypothetical protein